MNHYRISFMNTCLILSLGLTAYGFLCFEAHSTVSAQSGARTKADSSSSKDQGWEMMLGKGAEKLWRGYREKGWPKGWKFEDGVLCRMEGGDDLMSVKHYSDFELQLEWKISSGGNSGIMYRVSDGDSAPYLTGPEYQILDDAKHQDGKNSSTSAAALYGLYARSSGKPKPAGEWNRARIVLQGNHVQHWLNGVKVVDCEIGSSDWNERVMNSKFAEWKKFAKNKTGHLVLQDHGDLVWYRNIKVRKLGKGSGRKSN